ncbi:MAG: MBL fold metallo-hydrolase [Phycisphaerae bacterium]
MALSIDVIPCGPTQTNSYVLRDDQGRCAVVDPGLEPAPLLAFLNEHDLSPEAVLVTHGHADHIAGVGEVVQAHRSAQIVCPAADADMLQDPQRNMSLLFGLRIVSPAAGLLVNPGDRVSAAGVEWEVLDTSGHTPGGVSYYAADEEVAIVGDALFQRSIGRTDLPRADGPTLLANIRANLLNLPDDTRVLPGHGPQTTIGAERSGNPFLG